MKANKVLKTILIILIIIAISIISFLGINVQKRNEIVNLLPDYILGMDIKGSRRIELEVDTTSTEIKYDADGKIIESSDTTTEVAKTEEKKANEEENLTKENYIASKKVIESRLKDLQVEQYIISVNEENGRIVVEIPENEDTDMIVSELNYQGKFEILDEQTNEVLMTNNDIKYSKAGYATTDSGTAVYMNIQFNKEGTEKFKNITNTYIKTEVIKENNSEETTTEGSEETNEPETETVEKNIIMKIDDETILTTYFDKEVSNGLLQLSIGSKIETTEELQEGLISANNMAIILDNGKMPVAYEITQNSYVGTIITNEVLMYLIYALIAITVVLSIILIILYRKNGILSVFSFMGYIALLLILIRYTNVVITMETIFAIVFSVIVNYVFLIYLLQASKKHKEEHYTNNYKNSLIKWIISMLPIYIIAIIFVFVKSLSIFSIGMALFWGLTLSILYNSSVTNLLLYRNK